MRKLHFNTRFLEVDDLEFQRFSSLFPVVSAGGGLVMNDEGRFLLIFRKGFWDLPKGKLERGETIEACALREVKEETGLDPLEILKPLETTYHFYGAEHNQIVLKECYWYQMHSSDTKPPTPQNSEGITQAVWFTQADVEARYPRMYPTIRRLLEQYFLDHPSASN